MRYEPKHQNKVGPKPGAPMDRIVVAIFKHGQLSEKEIHMVVGLVYTNAIAQRKAMSRSVNAGWFNERAGKYSLSPWLSELIAARYEEKPKPTPIVITPPAYHPPFKPLKDMYAGVRGKVRDASFVTCSGVPSKVWGGV